MSDISPVSLLMKNRQCWGPLFRFGFVFGFGLVASFMASSAHFAWARESTVCGRLLVDGRYLYSPVGGHWTYRLTSVRADSSHLGNFDQKFVVREISLEKLFEVLRLDFYLGEAARINWNWGESPKELMGRIEAILRAIPHDEALFFTDDGEIRLEVEFFSGRGFAHPAQIGLDTHGQPTHCLSLVLRRDTGFVHVIPSPGCSGR